MSKPNRRRFTPEPEADLLRRHMVDKVPVSQICNEAQIAISSGLMCLQLGTGPGANPLIGTIKHELGSSRPPAPLPNGIEPKLRGPISALTRPPLRGWQRDR